MSSFEKWAAGAADPTFSCWLRQESEPDWSATVTHPFTDALLSGELSAERMRNYLLQDFHFVDHFVALLGAALSRADLYRSRMALARAIGAVTSDENTYFERAFDALGVSAAERRAPESWETTVGLTGLLDEVREQGSYLECVVVLVVTEWSYLSWARRAVHPLPGDPVLREWISLYDTSNFREWVNWLRSEVDRLGPELDADQRERCRATFIRATQWERAFFDACWE